MVQLLFGKKCCEGLFLPGPEIADMAIWKARSRFVEDVLGVSEDSFRRSPDLCRQARPQSGVLKNLKTGQEWRTGLLETPTLGELRALKVERKGSPAGTLSVLQGVRDLSRVDVGFLQALPENQGALFQVASNFNALELMHKFDDRAMHLVSHYIFDRTQGPYASISCAPGLLLRHYYPFYSEDTPPDSWRQVFGGRQLELLGDLSATVRNGYLELSEENLEQGFSAEAVRVAHHRDTQVAFGQVKGSEHQYLEHEQTVSQVFTATADLACTNLELFRLYPERTGQSIQALLQAAYEGTLRAALKEGKKRVFLTLIGGGVFANPPSWIVDILESQLDLIVESGLTVIVNTYRGIAEREVFERLVLLAQKTGGDLLLE